VSGYRADVAPQNGVATVVTKVSSGTGPRTFTATYGTAVGSVSHTVTKANTALVITPGFGSIPAGNALTVTVDAAAVPGVASPSGSIDATLDGGAKRTVALASGHAVLDYPALPAGAHTFTFAYAGDSTYNAADAITSLVAVQEQSTTPAPTVTTVTQTSAAQPGKTVALAVRVEAQTAAVPVGAVAFFVDDVLRGSISLTGGNATVSVPAMQLGSHIVKIKYLGAATFLPSETAITITVAAAPVPVVPPKGRAARH
jgi:hypothetical protein